MALTVSPRTLFYACQLFYILALWVSEAHGLLCLLQDIFCAPTLRFAPLVGQVSPFVYGAAFLSSGLLDIGFVSTEHHGILLIVSLTIQDDFEHSAYQEEPARHC